MTKNHYVGYPILKETEIPTWDGIDLEWTDGRKTRHKNELSAYMDDENFWWLVGRYLADGWLRTGESGIVLGIGKEKAVDIDKIPFENIYVKEERTVYKVHICTKEAYKFFEQFGKGAMNKHIPEKYKSLPMNLARAMLRGYIDGDGSYCPENRVYSICTVSRKLALDIGQLISYCWNVPIHTVFLKKKPTCIIEGRIVNQHDQYMITYKLDRRIQDRSFYENGWCWVPIKRIDPLSEDCVPVYDITVDDRHCFNANGIIVKNCTSISIAGKREGMKEGSGTASSLLWEIGRLLKDMRERKVLPEVLVMENVDAVLNKENIGEFQRWVAELGDMGYISSYAILNAKDYGTPQNRRRIFMVSTLTMGEFIFPDPCPDGRVLRDVLEDDVPESFFLSEERLKTFRRHKERNEAKGNGFGFKVHEVDTEKEGYAAAVTGIADRYSSTWVGIKDANNMVLKGELETSRIESANRVYGQEGISPTVTTKPAGSPSNPCPKIMVEGKLEQEGHWQIAQEVVSQEGLSPCITTHIPREKGVSSCPKVVVTKDKDPNNVVSAGELDDSQFKEARVVMDSKGISRTITAEHQGPNSPKVLEEDDAA